MTVPAVLLVISSLGTLTFFVLGPGKIRNHILQFKQISSSSFVIDYRGHPLVDGVGALHAGGAPYSSNHSNHSELDGQHLFDFLLSFHAGNKLNIMVHVQWKL